MCHVDMRHFCEYLCRDCALEGFIGRGLIGNVALWSPVMFCHLRAGGSVTLVSQHQTSGII